MNGERHQTVLRQVAALFDTPVIENRWRGLYVELLIAEIVGAPWLGVGRDWGGHDLEHPDGTRVEIKQSAARQSWTALGAPVVSNPRFGIRAAKGFFRGDDWTNLVGRRAHIYVFAWHPVSGVDADHRDEQQWEFFVISASRLPEGQASLGLRPLRALGPACGSSELRNKLEEERMKMGAAAAELSCL